MTEVLDFSSWLHIVGFGTWLIFFVMILALGLGLLLYLILSRKLEKPFLSIAIAALIGSGFLGWQLYRGVTDIVYYEKNLENSEVVLKNMFKLKRGMIQAEELDKLYLDSLGFFSRSGYFKTFYLFLETKNGQKFRSVNLTNHRGRDSVRISEFFRGFPSS